MGQRARARRSRRRAGSGWSGSCSRSRAAILVVTGTLSTAAGPHPGDSADIDRFWNLLDAVYLHVRATAAFGLSLPAPPRPGSSATVQRAGVLGPGAVGLLVLLLVQMSVGELQWRNELPWWLVLIHVGLAAAVWAWTVGLVTALWRTPRRTDVMSELRMVGTSRARAAGADRRLPGLERRRSGCDARARATSRASGMPSGSRTSIRRASSTSRRTGRTSRSTRGMTRRIEWPENAFYHARIPGSERDVVLLLGVEPSLRWKTFSKLVLDLARDLERRARRHARLAARRRAAHARGAGHRRGERPRARREPRSPALALRGADRDRRRAPGRLPQRGRSGGEPLGGGAALRLARAEPAGRARALRPARAAALGRRSTRPSSPRPRRPTPSRSRRRSPPTRRPPRTSPSSSAAPTSSTSRSTRSSRPATRSPPS